MKIQRTQLADGKRTRLAGIKTFLTPGWVLTAVIIIAFAYLAFTVLAPWQLGKNERTQARNHQLEEAFHSQPQPLAQLLDMATTPPSVTDDREWSRAEMTGRYLTDQEVILRNRPVNSAPAYQLLTPFKTESGTIIIVNRGFVHPTDGTRLPEIPSAPDGTQTIDGFLRLDEVAPANREPLTADGALQVYGISSEQIGQTIDQPQLVQGYLQLDEEQPGVANAIPLPQLSSGPYLSYGIQWIAFGILAPLGLAYFIWAEVRERRRVREEDVLWEGRDDAALSAAGPDPKDTGGTAADNATDTAPARESVKDPESTPKSSSTSTSVSTETSEKDPSTRRQAKLYDRYGGTRSNFNAKRLKRDEERF